MSRRTSPKLHRHVYIQYINEIYIYILYRHMCFSESSLAKTNVSVSI